MNWFALLIGAGASMAIWRVVQELERPNKLNWGLLSLLILIGAWIGARIAFFIWQPAILLDLKWQAFGLREGGMVWPGAAFGAWITVWLISLKNQDSFLKTADQFIVMLPPLVVTSWLAGWFSGSAYGQIMSNAWWVPMTLDDTFQLQPRFPLQLLAAFSLFLIYLAAETRMTEKITGVRTVIIWMIFSFHTLLFSFLRADPRPEWLGIAWDIWFVFACIIWGIIIGWMVWFKNFRKKKDK